MQVEIWEFTGYDGSAQRGDLAALGAEWVRLGGAPEVLAATHQGAQTFPARSGAPITVRGTREYYGQQVEVTMTYRHLFAADVRSWPAAPEPSPHYGSEVMRALTGDYDR